MIWTDLVGAPGDRELIVLVAGGDRDALGALYDRYAGWVYAAALRVRGDNRSAERLVRSVFLAAWRRASACPSELTAPEWLTGLAVDDIVEGCAARTDIRRVRRGDGAAGPSGRAG